MDHGGCEPAHALSQHGTVGSSAKGTTNEGKGNGGTTSSSHLLFFIILVVKFFCVKLLHLELAQWCTD